ncbi:MAG: zinc ribbon domain-containing protein [Oribacterium sp.]|nr:zinc ribbon domain-containing protein [Oribacterium sp.]
MFCFNCGAKIADGSNFCPFCGAKITNSVKDNQIHVGNGNPSMRPTFVPAKCTCCGATLEVDSRQEAAVCRFCNTPFIVEKAINNYNVSLSGNINVASATINIQGGKNLDNLIKRAKIFEEKGELRNALNYYEHVLDIDVENQEAFRGSERVKEAIRNYVYLSSDANMSFNYGTLKLMRGVLCYEDKKGKIKSYDVNRISDLSKFLNVIQFKYPGVFSCVSIGVTGVSADTWISAILNAQNGIYPNSDKV